MSETEAHGKAGELGSGEGDKEDACVRSASLTAGSASLFSSGINLLKTIIGAGIVSLPLAIYAYGYIIGIMLMILAAGASYFGLHLYIRAAAPLGRASSPFSLAALTYPKTWVLLDLAIVLKSLGVALAYLILIGQLMANFMRGVLHLTPQTSTEDFASLSVWVDTRVWVGLFMLVILPLSFLRKMDHLRYSSFLGLASIIYLTVLSVVSLFAASPPPPMTAVQPFPAAFGVKLLSSFGVFVFAFTCHQNVSAPLLCIYCKIIIDFSRFSP